MSREKQMTNDLIEIFDEEYSRRMLITPQNTAEKLTDKVYVKQSVVEWVNKMAYLYVPSSTILDLTMYKRTIFRIG